jgi:hypothetical protein
MPGMSFYPQFLSYPANALFFNAIFVQFGFSSDSRAG